MHAADITIFCVIVRSAKCWIVTTQWYTERYKIMTIVYIYVIYIKHTECVALFNISDHSGWKLLSAKLSLKVTTQHP